MSGKFVIWVPTFSRARRCFPLFLGRLLGRRACFCSSLSFLGWPSIFMSSSGPAQHALGRPQDRLAAAGSRVSRGLLQGAACPSSGTELIFYLHSVACLSSLGPTLLFCMFSAFPDVDSKVCVCVCVCVCVFSVWCVWSHGRVKLEMFENSGLALRFFFLSGENEDAWKENRNGHT